MGEYGYRRAGSAERGAAVRRRARALVPQTSWRAAQALAGNAALAQILDAEEPETSGERRAAAGADLPGLRLREPGFEIALATRTFDLLAAAGRPTDLRSLTQVLAGRRGRLTTGWQTVNGDACLDKDARVQINRRETVVRGRLPTLDALRWEPPDRGSTTDRIDLRRIAPAADAIAGTLRVTLGPTDLIDQITDVALRLDGHGRIELAFELPRGGLQMVGHDQGEGEIAWEYELKLLTTDVARVLWDLRPAASGSTRDVPLGTSEDDDGDEEEPPGRADEGERHDRRR